MATGLRRKLGIFVAEALTEVTGVKCNLTDAAKSAIFSGSEFHLSLKSSSNDLISKAIIEKCRKYPGFLETRKVEDVIHVPIDSKILFQEVVKEVLSYPNSYWCRSPLLDDVTGSSQTVIVEYSSPNIAKPFHAGHLRSTILGSFVSNIHEKLGFRVLRINYLGDWGAQVGMLLEGCTTFANNATPPHTLKDMLDVYVKANSTAAVDENFKERTRHRFQSLEKSLLHKPMESSDDQELWSRLRTSTIKELSDMYKRLGVRFDYIDAESMYAQSGLRLAQMMVEEGKADKEPNGAIVTSIITENGKRSVPLVTSAGATLYPLRDLAAALDRKVRFDFDKMVYVTEGSQKEHFAAVQAILKQKLDVDWANGIRHVTFGRVHGMSSRQGNMVLLADILDEAKLRATKAMQDSPNTRVSTDPSSTADALGVASVIINDFRCKRNQDYSFSWERAIRTKGDTGIFLQYAHSRLCSLEHNVGTMTMSNEELMAKSLGEVESLSVDPDAVKVIQVLAGADQAFKKAYKELEPSMVVHFLFKLVNVTNGALANLRVKGHEKEIVRVTLFRCARMALAHGLEVLGIEPLESM